MILEVFSNLHDSVILTAWAAPPPHGSEWAWHDGVPSALLMCCLPPAQRTATPARTRRSQSSAWLQMGG